SSRRRHTRSKRDWSSDVCSSDLSASLMEGAHFGNRDEEGAGESEIALCTFLVTIPEVRAFHQGRGIAEAISWKSLADLGHQVAEIGRASCREGREGQKGRAWCEA